MHKSGVVHVVQTARGIDTDNPQFAEIAFFLPSVTIRVNQAMLNLLFRFSEMFAATAVKALCELENLFMSSASDDSGFYSWHIRFPFLTLTSSDVSVPDLAGLALFTRGTLGLNR
jgi:hypothetical protein